MQWSDVFWLNMNLTVVYTIARTAVAWTAYLDVLAQYTVYKTTLDSDFENFKSFQVLFVFSSLVLYTVHCAKTVVETQMAAPFMVHVYEAGE